MKAVMYGAGNIGRGFIGAMLSQMGFEVVFIDLNQELVNLLNQEHCYPQEIVGEENRTIWISHIRAVNGVQEEAVIDEISSADVLAISVGASVLPKILPVIAKGLKNRWKTSQNPLDILICENLMHADTIMKEGLKKLLEPDECKQLDTLVGFVETAIGRMVPVMNEERKRGDPLRICVEAYDYLPINADALCSDVLKGEKLIPYSPFSYYVERKLYIHNMAHEAIACLGKCMGYSMIAEAASDARIILLVEHAMQEVCRMMVLHYAADLGKLQDHCCDLMRRFRNPKLKDTVERVSRDPIRKLQPQDRMIGALRECEAYEIQPVALCVLIAAVLLDANPKNPLHIMKDICHIQPEEPAGQHIQIFLKLMSKNTINFPALLHQCDELNRKQCTICI